MPATLHLERLWIRDVLITTGLVDTFTTPKLLKLIADGRLDPTPFATHRFPLARRRRPTTSSPTRRETQRAQGRPEAEPVAPEPELAHATATA